MSEEEYASKRERQKARRAERLEVEASQAKVANRRQQGIYGLVVVVVLALIGGLIFNQINNRRAQSEQAEAVAGRLDELGCTEDTRLPDLGGGHIAGSPEALQAEPPAVIYTGTDELPGEPPTSGRHIGQVVPSGVYDVPIDPRFTTHNLEHGYIVAWYSPDAPADQVEALKAWGEGALDGDFPKVIVAEYYEPLPDGNNVAFTGWFVRQSCETFDADVADVFARAHYDIDGEGPEKGIPGHTVGAQGVIDPDGEPLFLPPLDTEFGSSSIFDEVDDAENASPVVDPEDSTDNTDPEPQATE